MKRKLPHVVLNFVIFFVTGTTSVFAQVSPPLQYTSGAQSQALGRTISSKSLNALDASFNPASLSNFRKITSTLSFANTDFGGLNAGIGIAIPTKLYGVFGLSYHTFRGDLKVLDINSQLSTYSYNLNTIVISYGQRLLDNLAVGIGGKFVQVNFGPSHSDPMDIGLSASIHYQLPFEKSLLKDFKIGVLTENLIPPHVWFFDQRKSLPRELRVFIEKSFMISNSELNLISNIVHLGQKGLEEFSVSRQYYTYWGLQYSLRSVLYLRAGYINNLVWGGGIKINRLMLDYAYGDYNDDFPRTFSFKHFFSVSFTL